MGNQRVEIAMMVTPDGHSRLELSRFIAPPVVVDHTNAPVNVAPLPASNVRRGQYAIVARGNRVVDRGVE